MVDFLSVTWQMPRGRAAGDVVVRVSLVDC
jgi:hypothetical protein